MFPVSLQLDIGCAYPSNFSLCQSLCNRFDEKRFPGYIKIWYLNIFKIQRHRLSVTNLPARWTPCAFVAHVKLLFEKCHLAENTWPS